MCLYRSECNQAIRTVVNILCFPPKSTREEGGGGWEKTQYDGKQKYFLLPKKVGHVWSGHHEHILGWHCVEFAHPHSLTYSLIHYARSVVPHNEFIYFIGPKAIWCVFVSVSALELIKIIWWRKSTVSSVCFVHRWARTARMTCYKFRSIQSSHNRVRRTHQSKRASEQEKSGRIFLGPMCISFSRYYVSVIRLLPKFFIPSSHFIRLKTNSNGMPVVQLCVCFIHFKCYT